MIVHTCDICGEIVDGDFNELLFPIIDNDRKEAGWIIFRITGYSCKQCGPYDSGSYINLPEAHICSGCLSELAETYVEDDREDK